MSPAVVLGQDLADLAWPVYDSAVAILTVISRGEDHDSDVLVWVEMEADPSMRTRVKSSQGRACKSAAGAVQPARADALTRWHSLPILLAAYRTPGSCPANEWPTNDL